MPARQGARGERLLQVGEREVPILFTNRAIAEAERATGKGIIQMLQEFEAGGSINDVAHMLHVGMEHGRRDVQTGGKQCTLNDAFKILDVLGFPQVAAVVFEAAAAVLAYDPDAEDEDEDAGANPT